MKVFRAESQDPEIDDAVDSSQEYEIALKTDESDADYKMHNFSGLRHYVENWEDNYLEGKAPDRYEFTKSWIPLKV